MPYARQFLKVNILGHFGASGSSITERWVTGFHVSTLGNGSYDPANLLAFLTLADSAVGTFHSTTGLGTGSGTYYTGMNAALIGTDGKYVLGSLQPTTVFTRGVPQAGVGSVTGPFSQANVLTLRSLRLRGPASHGRMYWPCPGLPISGVTGVIGTTAQTAWANAAKTMLNSINNNAATKFGAGSNICLVSNVGGGVESVVTSVGVGGRLDHMESRERDLPEAQVTQNLTVSTTLIAERDEDLRRQFEDILHPDNPSPTP